MWTFLFLPLLIASNSIRHTPLHSPQDALHDVKRTMEAMDDILGWAKAHHYLLIVDFLFSIRVIQGELEMLSSHPSSVWGPDIDMQIRLLRDKADKLAVLALGEYKDTDNEYFKNFSRMVESKYYISSFYTTKRTFGKIPRPAKSLLSDDQQTFTEDESDNCMREILGTEDVSACTFSTACFRQMTNDDSEDYQLSHQLLYIILAQVRGCVKELDTVAAQHGHSVQQITEKYTQRMYQRLQSILESGRYDLFAEMIMIGQMLNYQEFYNPSIIQLLYLWQDTTGCYNDEALATDRVDNVTKIIGRHLFADEIIDESCSEHMTAIALVVLSLVLRHQLLLIPPPYQLPYTLILVAGVASLLVVTCLRRRRLRILRQFLVISA